MLAALIVCGLGDCGFSREALPTATPEIVALCLDLAEKKSATAEEKSWLLRELGNPEATIRAAATFALREMGEASPEVVAALQKNLDHPTQDTRSVAATALVKLGGTGRQILRDRIRSAPDIERRLEAVTALRSTLEGLRDPSLQAEMPALHAQINRAIDPDPAVLPGSPIQDGAFERGDGADDWIFQKEGGGEGRVQFDPDTRRRVGGSLLLEKSNSEGIISLRSRRPLRLAPGQRAIVRLYYHADDAPPDSALQILFEGEEGFRFLGDFHHGRTALMQNAVRNTAPGEWAKITAELVADKEPREAYIRILLRGNPATVWLDDIAAPAPEYRYSYCAPLETLPEPGSAPPLDKPATAEIRAGHPQGRARLVVDGKEIPPLLYFSYMNSFGEYAGMEALADIRLQIVAVEMNSSNLRGLFPPARPVWSEAGRFDFTTPLASLEHATRNAPESRFVIVFNIYWPNDWVLKNPEEAWVDGDGKRAYGNNTSALFGFGDTLPPGAQWWPSPFSEKAQAAAEEGIRQFVAALKKTPWESRVVGCHITGGHDEQFFTECFPDYSPAAVTAFRRWLRKKYVTVENLRAAWNDASLTFETATIPDFRKRAATHRLFFHPATERRYVDHRQFLTEQGMAQKIGFARAFKEAMGRPVVAMADQLGEIRSQGVDTLLEENLGTLDLIAAQPWYERRLPGYSGGIGGSLASFNARNKIGLAELDLRTWLRAGGDEINAQQLGTAFTPAAFRDIFRKEAAPMIASGNGYWLFDIGTTHWRDPVMLDTIAQGTRAYRELELENPTPFRPDVAIVWHDPSIYWMADTIQETLSYWKRFERYTIPTLKSSGVPFDEIALKDLLADPAAFRYKVYLFPNAFALSDAERQGIADILQKDGNVLIWNYAAGYVGERDLSDQGTSALTGMRVRSEPVTSPPEVRFAASGDPLVQDLFGAPGTGRLCDLIMTTGIDPYSPRVPPGFRRFVVEDPEATPLATYQDGKTAMAVRRFPDWTSIYSGMLGTLDPGLLNHAATAAEAHVLTKPGVVPEFNGHFLSLHGLRNGPVHVTLPRPSRVHDFTSGVPLATGKTFTLPLNAGETRWLRVESDTTPE